MRSGSYYFPRRFQTAISIIHFSAAPSNLESLLRRPSILHRRIGRLQIAADPFAAETLGDLSDGAAAEEWIEDDIADA